MIIIQIVPAKELEKKAKEYLEAERFQYREDNPNPDIFDFYLTFPYTKDLGITISKQKAFDYNLDIVSSVSFSPEHVRALEIAPQETIEKMLNGIFLWLTPREPEFFVELNPDKLKRFLPSDENFDRPPFYVVRLPLYTDELSLGNFMKIVRLVSNSSKLARRQIQMNLNPIIPKTKENTTSSNNSKEDVS